MNLLGKLRDMSTLSVVSLLVTLATMVEGVVLARTVGPTLLGIWFTLRLVMRYSQRLHLGVPNGFRRQLAVEEGAEEESAVRETSDVVFTFLLATGLLVAVAIVAGGVIFPGPSAYRLITPFVAVLTFLAFLDSYLQPYFKGRDRFPTIAWMQFLRFLASLASIGLTLRFGLQGFLVGRILKFCGSTLVGVAAIDYYPSLSFEFRRLRPLVRTGFMIMMIGFSIQLFSTVDRLVIIAAFPAADLGFYGTGDTFATILLTIGSSISTVLFTSFSQQHGEGALPEDYREGLFRSFRVFQYVLPMLFVGVFVAIPLGVAVFLPSYPASVPVGQTLAFGYIFVVFSYIAGSLLKAVADFRLYLIIIVGGLTLNLLANVAVLQVWPEILGVAVATALAYIVYGGFVVGISLRYAGVGRWAIGVLYGRLLLVASLSLAYVIVLTTFVQFGTPTEFTGVVVSAALRVLWVLPLVITFGVLALREFDVGVTDIIDFPHL